ncbi:MAG: MlaD family protein [Campylobacterota bacterium]|nr:MlaD family protein [Campylobacterota bacterium]
MYSKVNYTIIGIFVILFTAGMIFFAFWLGNTSFKQDHDLYMLRMKDSVSGLSKDSGVKLKGVDVGTVSDIRVNPKNIEEVEIILKINRGIPIKEDMRGVISMFGLTGLSYIEITGGTNSAKRLQSVDGEIPLLKAGRSFLGNLEERFEKLSIKFITILERGEKLLSDDNLKNFSALLDNTNRLALKGVGVEDKMISALDEAEVTLKEFRVSFAKLSKDYDRLAVDLHKDIKPSMKKFDRMTESINSLVTQMEKTVNRGDYNMDKIMKPTVNDMRDLTAQLSALTRELRRSPSDILYKSRKPRRGPGE